MIELLPYLKQMAAIGLTPTAALALVVLWKLNNTLNGFNMRLALLEQTTSKCEKC